MTNEQGQALHERLCAYVLDECTSEERAEIEREMLRSPELRAQRDTIERTVGLVKTAMGNGETLSPEAAQTLYSAASTSRPRAWHSSGVLRLAAGIGAVALGFAIVRESSKERDADVAQLAYDLNSRAEKSGRSGGVPSASKPVMTLEQGRDDASRRGQIKGLGYSGATPAQEKPADVQLGVPESAPTASTGFPNNPNVRFDEADKLAKADELVRRQRQLDSGDQYTGDFTNAPSKNDAGVIYDRDNKEQLGKKVEELYALDRTVTGDPRAAEGGAIAVGGRGVAKDTPALNPAEPQIAGEVLLGQQLSGYGGLPAPSTSPPPPPVESKMKSRGTYRGAGDSVAPGSGGGGTGGTGPSTPGPSGPATGAKKGDQGDLRSERWLLVNERGSTVFDSLTRDDESKSVPYYQLPPAEQQIYLDRECRLILEGCKRRPNEKPRDMFFRFWGDNPFEVAALDAQSTFAADVDTASYALARRYLNEGNVPEKAQIRTEEFVNYFKSDVPAPKSGVFAVHTDLAPSRFSTDTTRQMLRVVVRGKDLSKVERPRMNLTFVVDVSGSMREQRRLEMVKTSIRLLVTQLDPYDKIGIVKFSTDASVVLPLTSVSDRLTIERAIEPLQPDGSTNSNAGLELGYGMALGGLDKEATNRVVFLSDGVANVGETDPAKIAERVKPMREKGIYLNTIGVGMNNHNDVLLEQLADRADGMCAYIDTADEAKKQLVDNFSGAFQPIARDVKIQVEFDPTQVLRYRLLGYENRAIADADFRNDKVDAGELGAGHQVTALYEIERQGAMSLEKPLATVRVRWKDPSRFGLNAEADSASEITQPVASGPASTFEGAGQSYRKAVMAAQFAEILRRSVHARGDSLDALLNDALKLQAEIPSDKDFTEFVTLVAKSKDLILSTMPHCDELCQAIDEVRESHYRRAQLAELQRELDQKTLDELKRQNDVLEARLRDLVRRRLENRVR